MIDVTTMKPPFVGSCKTLSRVSMRDNFIAHHDLSSRTRVLIVEENGEMKDHFEQFLGNDFDLELVTTYDEAITVACERRFDIVIQDIEYEREFDAVLLTKQLRQLNHCKEALFISITGYVLPEGKSALKRAHFDYHLTKPFTLRKLRSILRLCIAKQTLSILNGINVEINMPVSSAMVMAEL